MSNDEMAILKDIDERPRTYVLMERSPIVPSRMLAAGVTTLSEKGLIRVLATGIVKTTADGKALLNAAQKLEE